MSAQLLPGVLRGLVSVSCVTTVLHLPFNEALVVTRSRFHLGYGVNASRRQKRGRKNPLNCPSSIKSRVQKASELAGGNGAPEPNSNPFLLTSALHESLEVN